MMKQMVCLCSLLMMFLTQDNSIFTGAYGYIVSLMAEDDLSLDLSAMDALDLVKGQYGANFKKIYLEQLKEGNFDKWITEEYYYKLPFADYYLVYEGRGKTEDEYLFHLYEFVLDEPDTGLGHTVTYGWYTVDKETGRITEEMQ